MNKPNMQMARKRTNQTTPIIECLIIEAKSGLNKKYFIKTYGCQMNEHDTENIKAILERIGFVENNEIEGSDLILLNTCSIRENVHNKVFSMLGKLKKIKKLKSDLMIVLCGCMAQEEKVIEKIIAKHPEIDLVFGTHNIANMPNLLNEVAQKTKIEVYSKEGEIYENLPAKREYKHKAWVNIMYGCDKFCTYCIVPYTRGKERSRKKEYILKEIKELIKKGYQEITLLGQNVNAYGKDLKVDYYMANLLQEVADLGMPRIRFMTSHPWDFSDDMIEVIKKNHNIMPHIHLPVQSGSNKILKLMGRNYTKEDYLKLYQKLKKQIQNVSISTDIIVGFPNETKQDFEETLDIVNKCKFDFAFTFIFSKRIGTPAAQMIDNISLAEKKERLKVLNEQINFLALESNRKLLNKKVFILVDEDSQKNKNKLTGYTEQMKKINFVGKKNLIGKIVELKVVEVKTWNLEGELLNKKG